MTLISAVLMVVVSRLTAGSRPCAATLARYSDGRTRARLTPLQWLSCDHRRHRFAFDSYELLMLPLIARPALMELLHVPPNSPLSTTGSASFFTYRRWRAASSGCWAATSPTCSGAGECSSGAFCSTRLGVCRRLLDVCLPTALLALLHVRRRVRRVRRAVAWLSELFPNPKQREAIVGYTQVVGSIGASWRPVRTTCSSPTATTCPPCAARTRRGAYTLMSGRHPGDPADRDSARSCRSRRPGARRWQDAEASELRRAVSSRASHERRSSRP